MRKIAVLGVFVTQLVTWAAAGALEFGCGGRAPAAAVPPLTTAIPAGSSSSGAALAGAGTTSCGDGMISVPAGRFTMGARDALGDDDEKPPHAVDVAAFCLDTTEVTVAAYGACVRAGKCARAFDTVDWPKVTDADRKLFSQFCNGDLADKQQHPVNCVDFNQAAGYCAWAGKRLPTEEEWEYEARGGAEHRAYPWGNDEPSAKLVNACGKECALLGTKLGQSWEAMYDADDGWPATAPVGSFPAGKTAHGALDMAGNVFEWTSSAYSERYDKPRGEPYRVLRGGAWDEDEPPDFRGADRNRNLPADRNRIVGFRCAR